MHNDTPSRTVLTILLGGTGPLGCAAVEAAVLHETGAFDPRRRLSAQCHRHITRDYALLVATSIAEHLTGHSCTPSVRTASGKGSIEESKAPRIEWRTSCGTPG